MLPVLFPSYYFLYFIWKYDGHLTECYFIERFWGNGWRERQSIEPSPLASKLFTVGTFIPCAQIAIKAFKKNAAQEAFFITTQ